MQTSGGVPVEWDRLTPAQWSGLCDQTVRGLLARFVHLAHAHEIALWVKDSEAERLVAVLDTAGPGGRLEMKVSQPLNSGIVSQVFRDQTPFLERGLWRSKQRSPMVDEAIGQVTQNEICVPFVISGYRLGVLSAVQVTDDRHGEPDRWGFEEPDLQVLQILAEVLAIALERSWLLRIGDRER